MPVPEHDFHLDDAGSVHLACIRELTPAGSVGIDTETSPRGFQPCANNVLRACDTFTPL